MEGVHVTELELKAIDDAYAMVIKERFKLYMQESDSKSAFGQGALERFTKYVLHAREARAAVVKVMVGDGDLK